MPDHSTFSKNRHCRVRDSDLLRQLPETTVQRCMAEGLVNSNGFAVDARLIRAEANRQRLHAGEQGLPPDLSSRAVDEYFATLDGYKGERHGGTIWTNGVRNTEQSPQLSFRRLATAFPEQAALNGFVLERWRQSGDLTPRDENTRVACPFGREPSVEDFARALIGTWQQPVEQPHPQRRPRPCGKLRFVRPRIGGSYGNSI